MKTRIAMLLFLFFTFVAGSLIVWDRHMIRRFQWQVFQFGTIVDLQYYTSKALDDKLMGQIRALFNEKERLYRPFSTDQDNLPYRISVMQPGDRIDLDPDSVQMIQTALDVSRETSGAFDITVGPVLKLWNYRNPEAFRPPSPEQINEAISRTGWEHIQLNQNQLILDQQVQIDLGAIAKGKVMNLAGELLESQSVNRYLIDIGGDLLLQTESLSDPFQIGLRHPILPEKMIGTMSLSGKCGVATSGDYERYIEWEGKRYTHIINPQTGYPVENILSVTVITKDAQLADAWATAFFVLGPEVSQFILSQRSDLQVFYVWMEDANALFWYTDSFPIQLDPNVSRETRLRESYHEGRLLN